MWDSILRSHWYTCTISSTHNPIWLSLRNVSLSLSWSSKNRRFSVKICRPVSNFCLGYSAVLIKRIMWSRHNAICIELKTQTEKEKKQDLPASTLLFGFGSRVIKSANVLGYTWTGYKTGGLKNDIITTIHFTRLEPQHFAFQIKTIWLVTNELLVIDKNVHTFRNFVTKNSVSKGERPLDYINKLDF